MKNTRKIEDNEKSAKEIKDVQQKRETIGKKYNNIIKYNNWEVDKEKRTRKTKTEDETSLLIHMKALVISCRMSSNKETEKRLNCGTENLEVKESNDERRHRTQLKTIKHRQGED